MIRDGQEYSYSNPPLLMVENLDAWLVWSDVKTQWRGGGMGMIGLEYDEVRKSCREMDITFSRGLKKKIQAIEAEVLSAQAGSRGPEERNRKNR